MSLQLSSKQSVDDVWIAQLDRKRVPQERSSGCKSSVAVTAVCVQQSPRSTTSSLKYHQLQGTFPWTPTDWGQSPETSYRLALPCSP